MHNIQSPRVNIPTLGKIESLTTAEQKFSRFRPFAVISGGENYENIDRRKFVLG